MHAEAEEFMDLTSAKYRNGEYIISTPTNHLLTVPAADYDLLSREAKYSYLLDHITRYNDGYLCTNVTAGPEVKQRTDARQDARFGLRDSGERTVYETGAQRDRQDEEKGRFELVSPIAMARLAVVYAKGCKKYNPRNWERGMPMSDFLSSALRHIYQAIAGDVVEDHLAQAAWNLFSAIHIEEMVRQGKLDKTLVEGRESEDPAKRIASAKMLNHPVDIIGAMKEKS